MPRIAFLFPGQGSQEVGMGRAFHQASAGARAVFDLAEKVTGMEIKSLCFEGPLDKLTQTANLQPALTTTCLAILAAVVEAGITPQAAAGHSLGEYPALTCAGALKPERAIALTAMRGDYMERDASRHPGSMAAVIGQPLAVVREAVAAAGSGVQVANHNAETQVVITGTREAVARAAEGLKAAGAKVVPLKVSGAWHSQLMSEAANDFAVRLAQTVWSDAGIPIYLNVTGKPETRGAVIGEFMSAQIISPVKWHDIMTGLLDDGFDTFVEVGPKGVLSGLAKKQAADRPDVKIFGLDRPESLEALKKDLSG